MFFRESEIPEGFDRTAAPSFSPDAASLIDQRVVPGQQ
jgi:hypothetical protein